MYEKYDKILIDGNNLFNRNWYVHYDQSQDINYTIISAPIKETLYSIRRLEKLFGLSDTEVYILWDNVNSRINLRKEIDPSYKLKRVKKEPVFYKSLDYLQFVLLYYKENYYMLFRHEFEADDLVKPLLLKFSKNDKVLLCSEDLDWSRLISEKVHWYAKNKIFDRDSFKMKYSFYPDNNNVMMFKAIRGDKVDGIPIGIPHLRTNILLQFLNDFNDIYDLLDKYMNLDYLNSQWKIKIKQNEARLRLNYQLVDFLDLSVEDINQYIFKSEYSAPVLSLLFSVLGYSLSEINTELGLLSPKKEKITPKNFFQTQKLKRF